MNDTTSTVREYPDFFVEHPTLTYGLLIFVGTGIVFGVVGNSLVIISCVVDKQLRTTANVFIVHLAVTDLGISGISHPFSVAGLVDGHRLLEYENFDLCRAVANFCFVLCISSIAGMMVVAINRTIAVVWPHKYKTMFTFRNCCISVTCLWVYPLLLSLPIHFGWGDYNYDRKSMICVFNRTHTPNYVLFVGIFAILIPTAIICICYVKIFWTVHSSKQKVLDRRVATITNPGRQVNRQRETRLAKTLFTIFIVFCIFWMPYGMLIVLDRGDVVPKAVHAIVLEMAHGNSCGINALVYYVTHDRFRRDFNLLLACRPHDLNNPQAGISTSVVEDRSTKANINVSKMSRLR